MTASRTDLPVHASGIRALVRYVGAQAPDSGGAQAGGVSPPFTVCAHSWFEVWGGELRLLCCLLCNACFAVRCAGCSVALALLLGAGERERHE